MWFLSVARVAHLNARAELHECFNFSFRSIIALERRLTFVAVVAAFGNTLVLLVLHPIGLAR
jgi:hypothetical protein